jgi:hypothetical protein
LRATARHSTLRGITTRRLIGRCLPVACAAALLSPVQAPAATVAVRQGLLEITTTAAGRNVIDVNPEGFAYRVYDSVDPVLSGEGCTQLSLNEAICGGMVMRIGVTGGDGGDLLGLWDVPVPVTVNGGAGDDLIETGTGADEVDAGPGDDAVQSAKGDDTVAGGDGGDRLDGGAGSDAIDGGADEDVIGGGPGDDPDLSGGAGADLVDGGEGDDELTGGEGDDALVATKGSDTVVTGTGNDQVFEGAKAPRSVSCSRRRRGRIGPRDVRCQTFSASRRSAPAVWPRPSSSSSEAQTAVVGFAAFVRLPGRASYVSVDVDAKYKRKARVCIWLYDRDNAKLQRFPAKVRVPLGTIKRPRPTRNAVFAEGALRKRGCRRKTF